MNLLFSVRDSVDSHQGSPLELWLKRHGATSVQKYSEFETKGHSQPLEFQAETPDKLFEAFIDPEDKFKEVDKFSQVRQSLIAELMF